jgi:hypothetical protein
MIVGEAAAAAAAAAAQLHPPLAPPTTAAGGGGGVARLSCPSCFRPLCASCQRGSDDAEFVAAAAEHVRVGRWLTNGGDGGGGGGGGGGDGAAPQRALHCATCGAEVGSFEPGGRFVFRGVLAEPLRAAR